MASCDDDDFHLLGDDGASPTASNPPKPNPHQHHHHHHHQVAATSHRQAFGHRFQTKASPIPPQQQPIHGGSPKNMSIEDDEPDGEGYADRRAFRSPPDTTNNHHPSFNILSADPFTTESEPSLFESESDPSEHRLDPSSDKLNDDEDGTTPYCYKKSRLAHSTVHGGSEYRKDREEWNETAIACLLDVYTDKLLQLNRGNLRGRDWEEVAAIVSERCEKQSKSVEQCKNKVDNLKKRYKLERHRITNGGISASNWPWFKQMELIVGNSLPLKAVSEEDKSASGSSNSLRQSKRYAAQPPTPANQINILKSKSTANPRWRRVVLKISGAALGGSVPHNIDPKVAMLIAKEVSIACQLGVQVAIVVGGRNFFCGDTWVTATGLDRSTAYQIGMMATVMNSILLQSALDKMGIQARVQTAFSLPEVAEPYSRQRAIRHLEKGRVVIFGGIGAGTGNPLFSTDTAAALRASEIHAEVVLKGTNLDGDDGCGSRNNGETAEHISFRDLASRGGAPMDMMAITFCEENGIPVVIFNLHESGNISRALCGEQIGMLIDQTGRIG